MTTIRMAHKTRIGLPQYHKDKAVDSPLQLKGKSTKVPNQARKNRACTLPSFLLLRPIKKSSNAQATIASKAKNIPIDIK
jgi:hypothetical protein